MPTRGGVFPQRTLLWTKNGGVHITARGEYAVRAMLTLAATYPHLVTVDQVVAQQQLPRKFLGAILTDLRRADLILTQRGPDGGSRLNREPSQISIADVIRAVEGPLAQVRGQRPDHVTYTGVATHLQTVWLATRAHLRAVLDHVSLEQVLHGNFDPALLEAAQRSGL